MPRAITGLEAIEIMKQSMVGAGTGVTESEVDTPGTDLNLYCAAVGACVEALSSQLVKVKMSASILSASGDALDELAFSYYKLKRKGRTPSVGTIRLARANDNYGAFTFAKYSRLTVPNGVEVETLWDADFSATDLFVDVPAKSVNSGKDYNIDTIGVVSKFITKPADRTLTCTNLTTFVGADDEWTDDKFKIEIINFAATLAKGTLRSIEVGAKLVAGVSVAKAENNLELVNGQYVPDGQVNLIIADANGMSNDDIIEAVEAQIEDYAPAGVYVFIEAGEREWLDIEVDVEFFNTSVNTSIKRDLIKKAIASYVNSLGRGEPYSLYDCASAINTINGVRITPTTFVEPSGITYPSANNKFFKTSTSRIKVNGT